MTSDPQSQWCPCATRARCQVKTSLTSFSTYRAQELKTREVPCPFWPADNTATGMCVCVCVCGEGVHVCACVGASLPEARQMQGGLYLVLFIV